MPRIVMLKVGKAADAELLCRLLAGKDEFEPGELEHLLLTATSPEAVVAMPAQDGYCRCEIDNVMGTRPLKPTGDPKKDARRERSRQRRKRKTASKSRGGGWVRGSKYGWWLCSRCHKPSKAIVEHFTTGLLAGNNDLLPLILDEGPAISPMKRWEARGGTRADYDRGTPVGNGTRRRI